jgi:hypothetical protein
MTRYPASCEKPSRLSWLICTDRLTASFGSRTSVVSACSTSSTPVVFNECEIAPLKGPHQCCLCLPPRQRRLSRPPPVPAPSSPRSPCSLPLFLSLLFRYLLQLSCCCSCASCWTPSQVQWQNASSAGHRPSPQFAQTFTGGRCPPLSM